jgi:ATP-dependent DNA ligase
MRRMSRISPARYASPSRLTALDENGRSSFQLLQGCGKAKHTPLVYFAFDLLSLDSADLRSRPFIQRSKVLGRG